LTGFFVEAVYHAMDYLLVPFDSRLEVALAAAGTAALVAFFVTSAFN